MPTEKVLIFSTFFSQRRQNVPTLCQFSTFPRPSRKYSRLGCARFLQETGKVMESYRVLFPIGFIGAAAGAILWPMYSGNTIAFYPRAAHASLMVFGFLLAFAVGFLMTAAPRMSGGKPASGFELAFASLLASFQILTPFLDPSGRSGSGAASLQFLALLVFIGKRFFRADVAPPPSFMFLPVGILLGLAGALTQFLWPRTSLALTAIGSAFLYKGFMMCFVLGVGARLLPVFLRGAPPPNVGEAKYPSDEYFKMGFAAAVYAFALAMEGIAATAANFLQLGILAWILFTKLRIHRLPLRPGVQPWGIWVSLWSILLGQGWIAWFPATALHGAHLIYISGWGLLTFLVATRVVLAHGGFSLQAELDSKLLAATTVLLIGAGLTRASLVFFAGGSYWSHVNYAALSWLVGISLWIIFGMDKFFRGRAESEEHC